MVAGSVCGETRAVKPAKQDLTYLGCIAALPGEVLLAAGGLSLGREVCAQTPPGQLVCELLTGCKSPPF